MNTTSEVIFIGDSTKTFTNLCLIISGFTYEQKLKLTFNNFKFSSNASGAISEPNGSCTTLEIQSIGDCSIGTTYYGGNVIDVPSEALLFAGAGGDGGNRGGIHPTMWGASCGEQGVGGNGGLALKVNGEQNISDQSNITCLIGDNGNPGTGTNQD